MAEQIDLRDLARRIEALEKRFDGVADAARQRQDDWGSMQSQAAKVPDLLTEMRELKRVVERIAGRPPVVAETLPAREVPTLDLSKVIPTVLAQLRDGYLPTSSEVQEAVKQEIAEALEKLDLSGLAERVYQDVRTAGVEEKLAKLLQSRVGTDVDSSGVIAAIVDRLLKELNLDELLARISTDIARQIADRLEVSLKRRYT